MMCDKQMYRDAVVRNRAQVCMACSLWQDCILRLVLGENQCVPGHWQQVPP